MANSFERRIYNFREIVILRFFVQKYKFDRLPFIIWLFRNMSELYKI